MTSAQLVFVGVLMSGIALVAFLCREAKAYKRGFGDGCEHMRVTQLELRNVEVAKPESFTAADRAILAALLELDRSDRETIH